MAKKKRLSIKEYCKQREKEIKRTHLLKAVGHLVMIIFGVAYYLKGC